VALTRLGTPKQDHRVEPLLRCEPRRGKRLKGAIFRSNLVLLCHKFRYLFRAAQHGHRDSIVASAATNLRRIVAIEL
jgi:hypothetical protein